jgi:uncharacterized protein involved in exopolysaccharide biosynthesis/Mrp family chromosome partitioning ATPase
MNPASQPNSTNGQPASPALSLDDIYFTLFRHKWLILGFICLGIIAAAALQVLRPPPYISKAKLMVLYVKDIRPSITASNQDELIMPVDLGPVVNSEMEIIKSLDVAKMVVDEVGPQRILAKLGGGTDRNAAIGTVASGVDVEVPPGTAILTVSFKHRDPDLVQPLLGVLLKVYQHRHIQVREKTQERDEYYTSERDKLNSEISKIDLELKQLKTQGQVIFYEDAEREYDTRISAAKDDLTSAERDLEEHKLLLGPPPASVADTNAANPFEDALPPDTIAGYTAIAADLETYKRREHDYIFRDGLADLHPFLLRVREQIGLLEKQKAELEAKFPALKQVVLSSKPSGTNSEAGAPPAADDLKTLTAKVAARQKILDKLQTEAARVLEIEPKLRKLERERDEAQRKYDSVVGQLSSTLGNSSQGAAPPINMSEVQSPTPPVKDLKKFHKLLAGVFGGCAAMGFALAFAFDLVIDRTIRRSRDIERHLRLPVFLAIPDTSWTAGIRWPWRTSRQQALAKPQTPAPDNGSGQQSMAIVRWSQEHLLTTYTEGLRERLMTYFEVHNLNLKKPKLVAVTGCTAGSGVTTLATGLAAELSKTGDGNVLYVDMNGGQGAAHPFYKGKPGLGLAQALEPEGKADARVEEKLYLANLNDRSNGKTEQMPSSRFNQLVPKLKASDYDYIIFDMPQVSPTSPTPRLAAHMDIVLLVLESEKTGQQPAARAAALMREARANVAAILNKCRPHVPERLSQDL